MHRFLRFDGAVEGDPAIDAWLERQPAELGAIAREWYARFRACGDDVRELMHDGAPTACIEDVAFGHVSVFKAHVNIGFFFGTELPDPTGLLEGNGKFMRHLKIRPGTHIDEAALAALIETVYRDLKSRLQGLAVSE